MSKGVNDNGLEGLRIDRLRKGGCRHCAVKHTEQLVVTRSKQALPWACVRAQSSRHIGQGAWSRMSHTNTRLPSENTLMGMLT